MTSLGQRFHGDDLEDPPAVDHDMEIACAMNPAAFVAGYFLHPQAGSGGPALQATLGGTDGVTVDRAGNVAFAASTSDGVVWVVAERTGTFYGQAMKAGDIYIVAGGGGDFLEDGRPATDAEILPGSVASTPDGGLLVTDQYSYRVRGISP